MEMKNLILILAVLGCSVSAFGVEVDPFADSCFITRGDCNHSGGPTPIDISDLTYFVDFMFAAGSAPYCLMEGDIDASGELDISDLTWLVEYMFQGGPLPPPEAGKDYVVWFWEAAVTRRFYGYHVLTRHVDSFSVPFWPKGMTISPDGNLMYISTDDSAKVVDLLTKTVIDEIPYVAKNGIVASPDGQMLAIQADNLYIIDAVDYSLIYEDTSNLSAGLFTTDGSVFYGGADETGSGSPHAYRLDLTDFSVTRQWFVGGVVRRVVPTSDDQKLLLYQSCGLDCAYFRVYDVLLDSLIFSDFIPPGSGELVVSSDDKRAYYSYPGSLISGPPPSEFTAFDIGSNSIYERVNTANEMDCVPAPWWFPVGEIVLTPDNRWLVGLRASGAGGPFIFNTATMEFEDCISLTANIQRKFLTCQTLP